MKLFHTFTQNKKNYKTIIKNDLGGKLGHVWCFAHNDLPDFFQ